MDASLTTIDSYSQRRPYWLAFMSSVSGEGDGEEIIMSGLLNLDFWTNLFVEGFWEGALIGLIIGAITFAITEKGATVILPMAIAFLIGMAVGLYMEGGALLELIAAGRDGILESTTAIRATVFDSVVGILHWLFAFLSIGALVSTLRRSILGGIIGAVTGTILGAVLILFSQRMTLSLSNPLADVLIAVACMLVLTVMALNRSES